MGLKEDAFFILHETNLVTVLLCVGSRLNETVIFTLLRMVVHPCCLLEVLLVGVSLLFTKP